MIAGDSIGVTKKGVILEKPVDRADAINMISTLQGSSHTIQTAILVAVWIASGKEIEESKSLETY